MKGKSLAAGARPSYLFERKYQAARCLRGRRTAKRRGRASALNAFLQGGFSFEPVGNFFDVEILLTTELTQLLV